FFSADKTGFCYSSKSSKLSQKRLPLGINQQNTPIISIFININNHTEYEDYKLRSFHTNRCITKLQ
ncbi:MAG: hypothetical protein ACJA1N_000587, partial [Saprospiraceae bacterium]